MLSERRKSMAISERSMVAGVFTNEDQARRAIDELRRSGFSDDQIRVAGRGVSSGGFLENLKAIFIGQGTSDAQTANDFTRLGVPEHEARYFQEEIQAGRTVVLVKASGGQQEAIEILRHNGAYDITAHLRSYDPNTPPGAYSPNAQQGQYANPNAAPGQYPPGSQPGQYNPNVPPGQYPPGSQPGQYNPNVPPGQYGNPNAAPGQYDPNATPGQYNPNVPPGQYGNQPPPPPDYRRERNP
jgi:hypothetical protein